MCSDWVCVIYTFSVCQYTNKYVHSPVCDMQEADARTFRVGPDAELSAEIIAASPRLRTESDAKRGRTLQSSRNTGRVRATPKNPSDCSSSPSERLKKHTHPLANLQKEWTLRQRGYEDKQSSDLREISGIAGQTRVTKVAREQIRGGFITVL